MYNNKNSDKGIIIKIQIFNKTKIFVNFFWFSILIDSHIFSTNSHQLIYLPYIPQGIHTCRLNRRVFFVCCYAKYVDSLCVVWLLGRWPLKSNLCAQFSPSAKQSSSSSSSRATYQVDIHFPHTTYIVKICVSVAYPSCAKHRRIFNQALHCLRTTDDRHQKRKMEQMTVCKDTENIADKHIVYANSLGGIYAFSFEDVLSLMPIWC